MTAVDLSNATCGADGHQALRYKATLYSHDTTTRSARVRVGNVRESHPLADVSCGGGKPSPLTDW